MPMKTLIAIAAALSTLSSAAFAQSSPRGADAARQPRSETSQPAESRIAPRPGETTGSGISAPDNLNAGKPSGSGTSAAGRDSRGLPNTTTDRFEPR